MSVKIGVYVHVHSYLQVHVTVYLTALCSVCDPGMVVVAQWIYCYNFYYFCLLLYTIKCFRSGPVDYIHQVLCPFSEVVMPKLLGARFGA